MVTYLDWIVILVTVLSAISMSFETPVNRIVEQPLLQVFYQKKNVLISVWIQTTTYITCLLLSIEKILING